MFIIMKPWKILQRHTYDLLSHKYSLVIVVVAFTTILVSIIQFGEVLVSWSHDKYESVFTSFSDNIARRSFQSKLCQNVPIDVVYTWVNGSDPELRGDLDAFRQRLARETSEGCPHGDCVPSSMGAFRGWLEDVAPSPGETSPRRLVGSQQNWTLVSFATAEETALACSGVVLAGGNNVTLSHAHLTTDPTAPGAIPLPDTLLLVGAAWRGEDRAHAVRDLFPAARVRVEPHASKGVLAVTLPDEGMARHILQRSVNVTLSGSLFAVRAAFLIPELPSPSHPRDFSASRFEDKDELRYSLRSLEQFAPWVRRVYLVTNGQLPHWLDLENPRLKVVTHGELFPDPSHLPTFSSPAIESHLHRIPGLSSLYLYLNDDVMFGREVWPEDFITPANGQKVYLSWGVPDCSPACPWSWVGDGACDPQCNNTACFFDNGDCQPDRLASDEDDHGYQQLAHMVGEDEDQRSLAGELQNSEAERNIDNIFNDRRKRWADAETNRGYNEQKEEEERTEEKDANQRHNEEEERLKKEETNQRLNEEEKGEERSKKEDANQRRNEEERERTKKDETNQRPNEEAERTMKEETNQRHNEELEERTKKEETDQRHNEEGGEKERTKKEEKETTNSDETDQRHDGKGTRRNNAAELRREPERDQRATDAAAGRPRGGIFSAHTFGGDVNNGEAAHANAVDSVIRRTVVRSRDILQANLTYVREVRGPTVVNASADKVDVFIRRQYEHRRSRLEARFYRAQEAKYRLRGRYAGGSPVVSPANVTIRRLEPAPTAVPLVGERPVNASYKRRARHWADGRPERSPAGRRSMDTFAESLLFVNQLLNRAYGFVPRKVPAHMPHMVDKEVMGRLQDRFPEEWQATSSHRVRSSRDMQFAFSYFYYLMSEKVNVSTAEIFSTFDTDRSGTWSDRELRTLLTRLFEVPLSYHRVLYVEQLLTNCSAGSPVEALSTPPYERYQDSKLPIISQRLVTSCRPLAKLLADKFGQRNRYKFEIVKERAQDVSFKMLSSNLSHLVQHLDDVRRQPKKFVCLNDNLDPGDNAVARAVLQDFYESLFPVASSFELPAELRNRFLHVRDLEAWRENRARLRSAIYVCLLGLAAFTAVNLFHAECRAFHRRLFPGKRPRPQPHTESV